MKKLSYNFPISTIAFILLCILFYGCQSNYDKASKLFKEKEYLQAVNLFKKVESTDENYNDANRKLNQCYYEIGVSFIKNEQLDSAILFLDLVNTSDPIYQEALSKVYYCEGLNAYKNGNYISAKNNFLRMNTNDEFYNNAEVQLDIIDNKAKEQTFNLKGYFQKAVNLYMYSLSDVGELKDLEFEVNNYTNGLSPADEDILQFIENLKNYIEYKIEYARTISDAHTIMDLPVKKLTQLESKMTSCKNRINSILKNKGFSTIKTEFIPEIEGD